MSLGDPGLGSPWWLTSVSSSPQTLWNQTEPVRPAPPKGTIDEVQAFCLMCWKWLHVGILGVQSWVGSHSKVLQLRFGAVIQVLTWMITAKVARSRIHLFFEAVIWNWSRKSQILIACITLVIHLAHCMVTGTCKWTPHASYIAYIEELQDSRCTTCPLQCRPNH